MRNKGNAENSDRQSSSRMLDLLAQEFMYGRGEDDWQDRAACAEREDIDPMTDDAQTKAELLKLCRSCPVREECAAYADEKNITSGIWGGTDRSEE